MPVILVIAFLVGFAQAGISGTGGSTDDWPQWRGLNRDGISAEKGLLQSWPDTGPSVLWRKSLGEGYSAVSVSEELAFTMFNRKQDEIVVALDANSGEEIWQFRTDSRYTNSWGNGPRVTPTVDGDVLYTVSGKSKLYALETKTGRLLWQRDLVRDFNCQVPDLGYSNSPLVEGDLLIVVGGAGRQDRALLAFDKKTGRIEWSSYSDQAGYSSPIAVTADGARQVVSFSGSSVVSVSPRRGEVLWRYTWKTDSFENVATPVFLAPDKLFFSSAHPSDKGSAVLSIAGAIKAGTPEVVWKNNVMKNHFSTVVRHDNYLYGTDRYILKCINAMSGDEEWAARGFGEGTLILVEGHLLVLGTRGKLALVEATPSGYREISSAQVLNGKCYTPPTLANGRLYLRNMSEIICIDLRDSEAFDSKRNASFQ